MVLVLLAGIPYTPWNVPEMSGQYCDLKDHLQFLPSWGMSPTSAAWILDSNIKYRILGCNIESRSRKVDSSWLVHITNVYTWVSERVGSRGWYRFTWLYMIHNSILLESNHSGHGFVSGLGCHCPEVPGTWHPKGRARCRGVMTIRFKHRTQSLLDLSVPYDSVRLRFRPPPPTSILPHVNTTLWYVLPYCLTSVLAFPLSIKSAKAGSTLPDFPPSDSIVGRRSRAVWPCLISDSVAVGEKRNRQRGFLDNVSECRRFTKSSTPA